MSVYFNICCLLQHYGSSALALYVFLMILEAQPGFMKTMNSQALVGSAGNVV
jgi:hypothetical protein